MVKVVASVGADFGGDASVGRPSVVKVVASASAKTVATGQKATRQAGGARARLGKRKGTSAQERHQTLNFLLQSPLPVGADHWW